MLSLIIGLFQFMSLNLNREPEQGFKYETIFSIGNDTSDINDTLFYTHVDKMPVFASCSLIEDEQIRRKCTDDNFYNYLNKKKKYTKEARKNKIRGVCVAQFIITNDGKIEKLKFLKTLGFGIEDEIEKILMSPSNQEFYWKAGEKDGKKVNVLKTVTIKFNDDIFGTITETTSYERNNIFTVNEVDELPILTDCDALENELEKENCSHDKFFDLIYRNLKYPRDMLSGGKGGVVKLRFIITKEGYMGMYKTTDESNKSFGKAVLETFDIIKKKNPVWKPAIFSGEKVDIIIEIPVKFRNFGVINPGF